MKVYVAKDVNNLKIIKQIPGVEANDVIAYNGIALLVAADGLYQYNYADVNNIRLLSKLAILK